MIPQKGVPFSGHKVYQHGNVLPARHEDRVLRDNLKKLPHPTFEQALTQTKNALKSNSLPYVILTTYRPPKKKVCDYWPRLNHNHKRIGINPI